MPAGPRLRPKGRVAHWSTLRVTDPESMPIRRDFCQVTVLAAMVLATLLMGTQLTATPAGAAAQSQSFDAEDEADYVDRINAIRLANGAKALVVDPNMTAAAREWTVWMVESGTLAHADDIVSGAPADWLKVGENVGRGGSLSAIWQAFLDSPSHAANVLDPAYDLVGVGVIWNAEGRQYTTHRFASTQSAEAADRAPSVETDRLAATMTLLLAAG